MLEFKKRGEILFECFLENFLKMVGSIPFILNGVSLTTVQYLCLEYWVGT